MFDAFEHRILVLMEDPGKREIYAVLLASAGYEVSTAEDGLNGLLQLGKESPDLIVCDIDMQRMSGSAFLSVVRRRLPQVLVVATGEASSYEVTADAFYPKGPTEPEALLGTIELLVRTSTANMSAQTKSPSPIEIACNWKDPRATPYIVVTCTECLQSFPFKLTEEAPTQILETSCIFCHNKLRYVIDSSYSVGLLLTRERGLLASAEARNPDRGEDYAGTKTKKKQIVVGRP